MFWTYHTCSGHTTHILDILHMFWTYHMYILLRKCVCISNKLALLMMPYSSPFSWTHPSHPGRGAHTLACHFSLLPHPYATPLLLPIPIRIRRVQSVDTGGSCWCGGPPPCLPFLHASSGENDGWVGGGGGGEGMGEWRRGYVERRLEGRKGRDGKWLGASCTGLYLLVICNFSFCRVVATVTTKILFSSEVCVDHGRA